MKNLDQILNNAVAQNQVPFVVAEVGTADGVIWSGAAGDMRPGTGAGRNTLFRIFSMTKAVGATAAMMLIERNKLNPDDVVETILPEFANVQVLDGFEGDTPKLRPPKHKATIRQLATHASGLTYEFWNKNIARYLETTGQPSILSGLNAAFAYPMTFDPGTRWDYGIGIDWLGKVIEAVDGRRIDRFCHEEIFTPLGMDDTAFEVSPAMKDRLSNVYMRDSDGTFSEVALAPPSKPEFYGMGHALYSTAPDYMTFIRLFLNRGTLDGQQLLNEDSVDVMLANHIGARTVGKLDTAMPAISADIEMFPKSRKTYSFGFLRVEDDVPGKRAAGSQSWSGLANTHF